MKKIIFILAVLLTPMLFSQNTFYENIDYMGVERTFITYVPANAGDSLVLLFHGHGGDAQTFIDGINFYTKADKDGVILVSVDGVANENLRWPLGTRSWNAYHCCGNSYETQVDDVGFISYLIDYLKYTYKVKNISALGFSNGGMLVHRLASEMPEKISAVADISGCIGGVGEIFPNVIKMPDTTNPDNPVSILMVHGKLDPVILYNEDWNIINDDRKDIPFEQGVQFWKNAFGYDLEEITNKNFIPEDCEVKAYKSSNLAVRRKIDCNQGLISITFKNGTHDIFDWGFVLYMTWEFLKTHRK